MAIIDGITINRTKAVLGMLRYLDERGPTREFWNSEPMVGARVMAKLIRSEIIVTRRVYAEVHCGSTVHVLEVTLTEKGRDFLHANWPRKNDTRPARGGEDA